MARCNERRRCRVPRNAYRRTPAEGLRGLVVKLGLHLLSNQADVTSLQIESAYSDLVRLTGLDPATAAAGQSLLARAGENLSQRS